MWPSPQELADLVTFTEEILNVKILFFVQWIEQMSEFCNKTMYLLTWNRAYIYKKINKSKPLLKILNTNSKENIVVTAFSVCLKSTFYVNNLTPSIINSKCKIFMPTHRVHSKNNPI